MSTWGGGRNSFLSPSKYSVTLVCEFERRLMRASPVSIMNLCCWKRTVSFAVQNMDLDISSLLDLKNKTQAFKIHIQVTYIYKCIWNTQLCVCVVHRVWAVDSRERSEACKLIEVIDKWSFQMQHLAIFLLITASVYLVVLPVPWSVELWLGR